MNRAAPSIPENTCVYAVGDIHGHLNRLEQIVKTIRQDARTAHPDFRKILVFLGDYADRGPDSRGVIEFLLTGLPIGFEAVFLRGNHEDVVLRMLEGDLDIVGAWLQFGGAAFLASYGVNPFRPRIAEHPDILRAELIKAMPATHRDFLERTGFFYECGDYYFTHAGVRPDVALDRQDKEDLMWIRHEFLNSRQDFGKIVVHGHTISIEPDIKINRIGIDTGAYATGRLTCVKLVGDTRTFFTT